MMGSSSMQKAGRLQWLLLALAGLLLIPWFVIGGSGIEEVPGGASPAAQAATRPIIGSGGACTRSGQGPSFGSTIVIEPNEVLCGDLTSFSGTVEIQGEIRGNVTAFNSDVIVEGDINGNVTLFGGTVTLRNGSQVHGNIDTYGASKRSEQGTQLDGTITQHTGHAWFLSILLAPAVLVVLIALILPIPLALILALGLIAAWALGTVAIGWIVGERIMHAVAPQYNTRLIDVVVGLTVLVLVGSLPYIGWLISIGVGLLGLGAVFLSRFGTRLYSQPKQPLTL